MVTVEPEGDSVFQHVRSILDAVCVESGIETYFREYVSRYRTARWGIFSDYVVGDRSRPSDAFVFTVAPLGEHLTDLFDLALDKSTPDIKDVKAIPDEMRSILLDERFFSFCFAMKKGDRVELDNKIIVQGTHELITALRGLGGEYELTSRVVYGQR